MKTFANSLIATAGHPASAVPAAPMGRNQMLIQNASPVRLKFGWEEATRFTGSAEGVPLEPGDWRILGGDGVDLRGALYLITDDLSGSMTGDVATGSAVVTDVQNPTASLLAGMRVSGVGIPDDTYIASVDSATQITLTRNATATTGNTPLTLSAPVVYTQR
jgi:hypothetical protein